MDRIERLEARLKKQSDQTAKTRERLALAKKREAAVLAREKRAREAEIKMLLGAVMFDYLNHTGGDMDDTARGTVIKILDSGLKGKGRDLVATVAPELVAASTPQEPGNAPQEPPRARPQTARRAPEAVGS